MKKLLLALAFSLFAQAAWAQNPTCPTRPFGDNSNACASTAFVAQNAIPGNTCTIAGGFPVYDGAAWQCSTAANSTATLNGGPFTINPTSGTTTKGLFINHTTAAGSSTSGVLLNQILIADNVQATTTAGITYGLNLVHIAALDKGAKTALYTELRRIGASLNGVSDNYQDAGFHTSFLGQINNGGSNTAGSPTSKGSGYAFATTAALTNSATNWLVLSGGEIDVAIDSTSSSWLSVGLQITHLPTHATQGAVWDEALSLTDNTSSPGSPVGWKRLISINSSGGQSPVVASSKIFATVGDHTFSTGMDFQTVTPANCTSFLVGPGTNFNVACAGNLAATSATASRFTGSGTQTSPVVVTGAAGQDTFPIVDTSAAGKKSLWEFADAATPKWFIGKDTDNAWIVFDSVAGVNAVRMASNSGVYTVTSVVNAITGFRINGAATSGNYLRGNGTNFVSSAITLADFPTQATNTVLGNATSGTAVPTALAVGTCSTAASALIWTTNTGFGCNTSITAAAVPVSGITGLGTGVATALAINTGTAGSFVVNGGALGSPSSVGTLPAHTIGGTITGGGNTITNVVMTSTTLTSPIINGAITSVGTAALTWTIGRASSGAGNNYTIQAGGAQSTGTDLAGGTLILSSGIGTGSVTNTQFGTFVAIYAPAVQNGSGTGDVSPTEAVRIGMINATPYGGLCFRGATCTTAGNYALVGSSGDTATYLNGKATISLSVDATAKATIDTNGLLMVSVTDASSTSTGAIRNPGGMSVNKRVFMNGLSTDAAATDRSICQDTTSFEIKFGSGAAGICLGTSSARYKELIEPMGFGLSEIKLLQPKSFFYKKGYGDDGARQQFGFLAEDVFKIEPRWVGLDAQGRPNSVDWPWMLPAMVNAVKDIDARLSVLEKRRVK